MAFRLLAVILLTAMAASSQPPSPDKGNQDKSTSGVQAQTSLPSVTINAYQSGGKSAEHNWRFDWSAVFTLALVVVGAMQVYVYCRQAEYMRKGLRQSIVQTRIANRSAQAAKKSADIAEETLRLSQRAVVGVEAVTLKRRGIVGTGRPDIDRLSIGYVEFLFKNFGATIAEQFYFTVKIQLKGLTRGSISSDPIVSRRTTLMPQHGAIQDTATLGQLFGKAELAEAFMRGSIEANGFLRYKDLTGSGTYMKFACVLDPATWIFRITTAVYPDGEQPPEDD